MAVDVERGFRLGVAQALGIGEDLGELGSLELHPRQDVVAGAIDDAGDARDPVAGEGFAQGLDDRDAPGHRRFKSHHHAPGLGSCKNFGAVHGQQGLVGRDHMLACCNGFHHQSLGDAITANQLDDNVDFRVGNDLTCIRHHLDALTHHLSGTRHIQIGHHGDLNATTCATLDFSLIAAQHIESAAAHGANAQQAYFDRFHL